MLTKTTSAIVAIVATLGMTMIGMTTVPYSQTAVADRGGIPNDSALNGPACENAGEKHDKKEERLRDDNPNNDNGAEQAHDNTHNSHGVESKTC